MILSLDFPFPFETPWIIQGPNPVIGLGSFRQGAHATCGYLKGFLWIFLGTPRILGLGPLYISQGPKPSLRFFTFLQGTHLMFGLPWIHDHSSEFVVTSF